MPIESAFDFREVSQKEFHRLAREVIGISFEIHNEIGRLMDEAIYQEALRIRCEEAGLGTVAREAPIHVTHSSFRKTYFLDLLLNSRLIIETKTTNTLAKAHQAQTLHYLFLTSLKNGLLINFRPNRIEKRFVSTSLNEALRKGVTLHTDNWEKVDSGSADLLALFKDLLSDWGAYLEVSLYREAAIHFFGGPKKALQEIEIKNRDGRKIGHQKIFQIAPTTAAAITSIQQERQAMRSHLEKLIKQTPLSHFQWVNLNRSDIEFITISR